MSKAMVDYALIGRRIRYYRKLRQMTQAQLAEYAGTVDNYISMIESGYKKSSLEMLVSICNALNITMDVLLVDNQTTKYLETHSMIEELFSDCTKEESMFVIDAMASIIDTLHNNRYALTKTDL